METPYHESYVRNLGNYSQTLCFSVECFVSQESAYENRSLIFLDRQVCDAISSMAKARFVEVGVHCKERDTPQTMEYRNDCLILCAHPPYIVADLVN